MSSIQNKRTIIEIFKIFIGSFLILPVVMMGALVVYFVIASSELGSLNILDAPMLIVHAMQLGTDDQNRYPSSPLMGYVILNGFFWIGIYVIVDGYWMIKSNKYLKKVQF